MRYFIVDDDKASRVMLKNILAEQEGIVIGEAESGVKAIPQILSLAPDVVLIDLLMPELDGIETIQQLKTQGYNGQFIMLSQVVNKEMVGEAYQVGVEFFIHKPINQIEVQSIVRRTAEQLRLKNSLLTIRESLAQFGSVEQPKAQQSVKDIVLKKLHDMGIFSDSASRDIVAIMEVLNEQRAIQLPPLKELYEAALTKLGVPDGDISKESKAMEQRIRRSILTAMEHLASLGAVDYTIDEFEYYAPRFFDFQEISLRMKQIQEESIDIRPAKVNSKKFLHVLYMETIEGRK
ncbi:MULTISPECIES: response regulator [unclassified Sporosarcina]|uniref:response regulator n=1 Tax=unclassified Sporosarcina TaxID=2647733 RepID=UPI000C1678A8|nr:MULTISPECIES: response regulator [unclassified Sporosarcina]PIC98987.1 histidine kinase [Sporosarcina sp. P29]PID05676.1 histidine kinase [Sporosarcina sp. P30]PID08870.1 histidine kinase [Sporosarcina sp. P31]PID11861.1 histidine kinase [Sporosarcina sp. P32b]